MLRRQDLGLGDFLREYTLGGVLIGLALWLVLLLGFWLAFTVDQSDKEATLKAQNFTRDFLAAENPQEVQTLLLTLKEEDQYWLGKLLSHTQNGEEGLREFLDSPVSIPTWEWNIWGWSWLPFLWVLLALGSFLNYAVETIEREMSLIDLPWRKPWVWAFALFTAPFSTLFFIAGAANLWAAQKAREEERRRQQIRRAREQRLREAQRREEPRPQDQQDAPERGVLLPPLNEELRPELERAWAPPTLAESKAAWLKLRKASPVRIWRDKLRAATKRVKEVKTELRQLIQDIADLRRKIASGEGKVSKLQNHLQKARESLERTKSSRPKKQFSPETRARYQAEFEELLRLPRVLAARVSESEIILWTHPIFEVEGRHYDLGAYAITINPKRKTAEVECLLSGRKDGRRQHPYTDSGRSYGFCFGERRPLISRLIEQGEYLPALSLMLEGLWHINPEHRDGLGEIYKEVLG